MTQKDNFFLEDNSFKSTEIIKEVTNIGQSKLLSKYFRKWKDNLNIKTDFPISMDQMQQTKINRFITTIKNQQDFYINREIYRSKHPKTLQPHDNIRNRYKVQNNIIDLQKEKIKEQNKIINELKLGIIREDIFKSTEKNKNIIREIFGNCSEKLLCKVPLIKDVEEREKIMISAQKAPKLVQIMHQRAIEREKYREEILKRKRIKEEAQQEFLKELVKNKKSLEEEERKKNLEIINEQRKQELKLQKVRQQKRQHFEQQFLKAVTFYNKILIKQCFKKLINFLNKSKENMFLADTIFVQKQKLKVFKAWLEYVEAKYSAKYNIADVHFKYKIKQRSINRWMKFKLDCVRSLQVAEDLYDFRLTSNTFIHWHRYVCKEIMIEHTKYQVATKHNNRRMLFQYFYRWRYLPAVIQLEKSKEEMKRKWREKVWEILPDFRPSDL